MTQNGESIETAVVINEDTTLKGISMEYYWMNQNVGRQGVDWTLLRQELHTTEDGKHYDILVTQLPDGTQKKFYFEITRFFGQY